MKKKITQGFLWQKLGVKALCLATTILLPFFASAQTMTLNVGGTNRTMFVHVPSNLGQNRPLVISMHGLNQDINYQKGQAKWEQVADTAKFVVVYPAGVNNSWDISGTRDTDFITAIINDMATRYTIDRNRVYVSGFSMGGMMSYHVANRLADRVAAIGPVSGYLFGNTVASSRPMPIIHVHGNADDVVRYEPYQNQQGVVAMLQKWRTWNGCPSTGTRTTPYPTNRPNSKSIREYWGPCNNSEVELITLDGKGHWHSNDDAAGVHTTRELWRFFKRHSLSTGPAITLTSPALNATFTAPATINLAATASVSSGTISNVRFYNGTTLLNTDNAAPFSFSWTNVAAGTYSVRAVATDNQGRMAEVTQTVRVNVPQGAYNGTIHQLPVLIQAEHFDVGGNGSAYNDNTPGSQVTPVVNFRTNEDVDIENTTDAGGGYNIAYIMNGEWLEYTVNVTSAGAYSLDLRMAADGAGKTLHVEVDGVNATGAIAVPNTAGWQIWQTATVNNLNLTQGQHIIRVAFDSDYMNLNWIEFKKMNVTGLEEERMETMQLFPNPSEDGNFNLSLATEWRVYNTIGEMILQGYDTRINLSDYPSGIYILESKFGRQKIVKQ
jgi:poly(hydroxyalkanoate) depolymerase family esterase